MEDYIKSFNPGKEFLALLRSAKENFSYLEEIFLSIENQLIDFYELRKLNMIGVCFSASQPKLSTDQLKKDTPTGVLLVKNTKGILFIYMP